MNGMSWILLQNAKEIKLYVFTVLDFWQKYVSCFEKTILSKKHHFLESIFSLISLSSKFIGTWLNNFVIFSKIENSKIREFDLLVILQKDSRQSIHWAQRLYKNKFYILRTISGWAAAKTTQNHSPQIHACETPYSRRSEVMCSVP